MTAVGQSSLSLPLPCSRRRCSTLAHTRSTARAEDEAANGERLSRRALDLKAPVAASTIAGRSLTCDVPSSLEYPAVLGARSELEAGSCGLRFFAWQLFAAGRSWVAAEVFLRFLRAISDAQVSPAGGKRDQARGSCGRIPPCPSFLPPPFPPLRLSKSTVRRLDKSLRPTFKLSCQPALTAMDVHGMLTDGKPDSVLQSCSPACLPPVIGTLSCRSGALGGGEGAAEDHEGARASRRDRCSHRHQSCLLATFSPSASRWTAMGGRTQFASFYGSSSRISAEHSATWRRRGSIPASYASPLA